MPDIIDRTNAKEKPDHIAEVVEGITVPTKTIIIDINKQDSKIVVIKSPVLPLNNPNAPETASTNTLVTPAGKTKNNAPAKTLDEEYANPDK